MNRGVRLDACAALTAEGIQTDRTLVPWNKGQSGPADIERRQVLADPYPAFGKLPLAERLCFSVASLVLAGQGSPPGERTGITLGIPLGSLSNDLRYIETVKTGFPSPAIFWATLPSAGVSEVAIYHRLKGPNRVITQVRGSGVSAIECAARILRWNKAEAMLALVVNACADPSVAAPFIPSDVNLEPWACAFLLGAAAREKGLGYRLTVDTAPTRPEAVQSDDREMFGRLLERIARDEPGGIDGVIDGTIYRLSIAKDA